MTMNTGGAITDELISKVQNGSAQMSETKAVALAAELYSRGRYKQAVNVCRQILQHKDGIADAHNILGVSLSALGQGKPAVAALKRAIKYSPKVSSYHANLGEVLRINDGKGEALTHLLEAIRLDPLNAQAHNNMGIIHYEKKEYDQAVACYRAALALDPALAEAWNNLGNSLRLVDDLTGAQQAYEQSLSLREEYPEAYNNLGTLLRELDRNDQAEHALRKAILQNPKYVDAHLNLAGILHAEDKDLEALRLLGDVLKFDPRHAKTLLLVARVQTKRGAHDLAEQACRMILEDDPQNADAYLVLGQLMHETDNFDTALSLMEKAVDADPENAEVRNFYGVTLKSLGRLEEAKVNILQAIDLNEKMFGSYANLNDIHKFTKDDPYFQKIEGFLQAEDPDSKRALPLHYAYAKALEDMGEHERALDHYITGGQIKRAMLNYVEADSLSFFDRIRDVFSAELFANKPFAGVETARPIFIVGMPRSGSTLVEQILSSHPDVHGAGEVKYISSSMHALRDRFPTLSRFPDLVNELNAAQFNAFAQDYLKRISIHAGNSVRTTDKLLTNYFFVGLIHIVFPNARIINTQRNPIDNCLSAFTKLFKDDMPHSYDLGELGRYYLKYDELMGHWRNVIPADRLKIVQYENVVEDTEGAARDLLAFLDLPWCDDCLNFHESNRPVKTASVAQIRKPIYADSIERWRKYGPKLEPLVAALGLEEKGNNKT